MKRNIVFIIILTGCLWGMAASAALPDSLRPDWQADSNGIKKFWQTGDTHQDYHRIVTDGNRIFVANGSQLIRLVIPYFYDDSTRLFRLGGTPSLFDTVRILNTWDMPARIEDMFLSDTLIWLALGKKGVQIYALRPVPQPVGSPPKEDLVYKDQIQTHDAYTIAYNNGEFYIGTRDGVKSFYYDRLGFLRTDGTYGARGTNRQLGFYNAYDSSIVSQGNARRMVYTLRNSYAFVEDDSAGFRVLDVTRPSNLSFISWLPTPASPRGIAVRDTMAYTIDHDFGFRIYNVANPIQTKLVGGLSLPGAPNHFILTEPDRIAFIATGDHGGIRIIMGTDPYHPHEAGYYETPGTAFDVSLVDDSLNILLVADGRYLALYDFTEAITRIDSVLTVWYPVSNSGLYDNGFGGYTGYEIPMYTPGYSHMPYPRWKPPHQTTQSDTVPDIIRGPGDPVKPRLRTATNTAIIRPTTPPMLDIRHPPTGGIKSDTTSHPVGDITPRAVVKPRQKPPQVVLPTPAPTQPAVIYTPQATTVATPTPAPQPQPQPSPQPQVQPVIPPPPPPTNDVTPVQNVQPTPAPADTPMSPPPKHKG